MSNYDDRYIMPFGLGGELTAQSFRMAQYDNTYILAAPRYYQFYAHYIRPRMLMYSGWIDSFHNIEYGVIPSLFLQKIGNGIKNTIFGKPIVLNTENPKTEAHIKSKTFKKSGFMSSIKESYGHAIDGGTVLIKWNRDGQRNLRFESVPMNRFFVEIDAYGDIERTKCFIATYHDTISVSGQAQEYYLCEERFFRYTTVGGVNKRYPFVHYTFYKTSSNISSDTVPKINDQIRFKDIPYDIRNMLKRDYGDVYIDDFESDKLDKYDNCVLMPFDDDLGCRIVKFTENIPAFPKMPFGQPLADLLMNESYQYDQLKFFERAEVYIARGRIMVDEGQLNPNDPEARKRALDQMVFTYYDNTMNDTKDGKPIGIQLDLRAENIKAQKQNILNDTAFALNLSSSTIAAWLSDGITQKTATEIEFERTKTESFINEKISLIQDPYQEMADLYFHYCGLPTAELHIMPENQAAKTENIRLYSELFDKGQIPAKKLAEEILGTCSRKEVGELQQFIEQNQLQQQVQQSMQLNAPQVGGEVESPANNMQNANAQQINL